MATLSLHDVTSIAFERRQTGGSEWIDLTITDMHGDVTVLAAYAPWSMGLVVIDKDAPRPVAAAAE